MYKFGLEIISDSTGTTWPELVAQYDRNIQTCEGHCLKVYNFILNYIPQNNIEQNL